MGLSDKSISEVVASMASTRKGLMGAQSGGGHFYFVGDAKGSEGALIVYDTSRDRKGKKTLSAGRSLMKIFRDDKVTPLVYSIGTVQSGDPLIFNLTKGSAKPAQIRLAFKSAKTTLHQVTGMSLLLQGVRFKVAGQEEQTPASREQALNEWRCSPKNARMIAELGLSDPVDIEDLFDLAAADAAFDQYAKSLPHTLDEETRLEEARAGLESDLRALNEMSKTVVTLQGTDLSAALQVEETLNQRRAAMARTIAVGGNPFEGETLDSAEHEAFTAMTLLGAQLLTDRMRSLEASDTQDRERLMSLPNEAQAQAIQQLQLKTQHRIAEMRDLSRQLDVLAAASKTPAI